MESKRVFFVAHMNVVDACVYTHVYEGMYAYIESDEYVYMIILYNLRLCMYIFWCTSCTFHPPMLMPSTPCGRRNHRMQLYVYLQMRERERENAFIMLYCV